MAAAIAAVLGEVLRVVQGERIEPAQLWSRLARRFTLIGVQGVVRMAMSGFDVACRDAPADEAERLLERGFRGVKLRLGRPRCGGRSRGRAQS